MDSLRAIAAISVFFAHGFLIIGSVRGDVLSPYLARLDIGVSIFLTISAFLLYRPFVQARFEGRPMPRLVPFGIRRVLRIVPAYWLALTGVALWLGLDYVFSGDFYIYYGLLQVYDADTIDQGIGQAWTVCVEITFYLLLPVWALTARRSAWSARGELVPIAAMFVAGVVWKLWAFQSTAAGTTEQTPGIYTLPAFFDFFAVGMALAVVSVVLWPRSPAEQPRIVQIIDRRPWAPWLLAAAAFWVSGVVGGAFDTLTNTEFMIRHELNGLTALGLLLPVIFGDQTRGWVRRVLANRFLLWLGMTSYAFYLWHLAILLKFRDYGVPDALGGLGYLVVTFALALAIGGASWYALEVHALRLGRRLSRREQHIPTPKEEIELTHVPLRAGSAEAQEGRP